MATPFSFGFSGDDIERTVADGEAEENVSIDPQSQEGLISTEVHECSAIQPEVLDIKQVLDGLPSKISYSSLKITTGDSGYFNIPRRELFDVRLQLMAEDECLEASTNGNDIHALNDLGDDDIRANVYEGGLKSWECSVDLARYLNEHSDDVLGSAIETTDSDEGGQRVDNILELGAGTALPTLAVLRLALLGTLNYSNLSFIVCDYNKDVLRTVTIPNMLLMWASIALPKSNNDVADQESDLEISPDITKQFLDDLARRRLSISAISGGWGAQFIERVNTLSSKGDTFLILASETIYSPATLGPFTNVVLDVLESGEVTRALVAAKRLYFGVGGGVNEFVYELEKRGGKAREVAVVTTAGVSRLILDVAVDHDSTKRGTAI